MPPDRAFPVVVEMGHPVTGLDQRWALALNRVCEANAVRRGAEANLVLQRHDRTLWGGCEAANQWRGEGNPPGRQRSCYSGCPSLSESSIGHRAVRICFLDTL